MNTPTLIGFQAAFLARLDVAIGHALDRLTSSACPPSLAQALRHAMLPSGSRRRPMLCYAVADALGDTKPLVTDSAAAALELIHCASLVHDDLPCFDDAAVRRGRPSVHAAFGQPLAVLTGDALILGAIETLTFAPDAEPALVRALVQRLCAAAGAPRGMCAGQAWESEPAVDLARYHAAKTSTLIEAAASFGALVTGHDPEPWSALGSHIGAAYQIADDIRDVTDDPTQLGKPVGRDLALGRPSIARTLGVEASREQLSYCIDQAMSSIPPCSGRPLLTLRISAILEELKPR